MKIEYDSIKRAATLETRGLEMADAYLIFEADKVTIEDVRFEYSEKRIVTFGYLADRMIVLVWTERGSARRIISMGKTNDREQALYAKRLGRPR